MINDEKQLREDFAKYGDDIIREMLIEYSLLPNEIEETVSFFHPYVEKLYNHELSFDVFHSVEKLATESIYNMASYKDGNTALVDLVACVDLEKLGKKMQEINVKPEIEFSQIEHHALPFAVVRTVSGLTGRHGRA